MNHMDKTINYRLPTEAEWEYSARCGTDTKYWFENDPDSKQLHKFAWYKAQKPNVVAGSTNLFDLYDMYGNVYEWTSDWCGPYPSLSVIDPIGPSVGSERVIRGGSFASSASKCSSNARACFKPEGHSSQIGFRIIAMKQ